MLGHPLHKSFGKETAEQGKIHLHHVRQIEIEHVADCFFKGRMISANVENAVTAKEIKVGIPFAIIKIGAFGPRINFIKTDGSLNRYQGSVDVTFVQVVVLAESVGNELFDIKWHFGETLCGN